MTRSTLQFAASIAVLIISTALVWFVLPLVPGNAWLQNPLSRMGIILLLVFCWGAWHAWRGKAANVKSVSSAALQSYIEQKKASLTLNSQAAYHFLYQHDLLENEVVLFLSLDLSHSNVLLQNRFEPIVIEAENTNICRWYVKDRQTIIVPNLAAIYTEWKDSHSFEIANYFSRLLKPYRKHVKQVYIWLDFNTLTEQNFKNTIKFYNLILPKFYSQQKIATHFILNVLQHLDGYKHFLENFDEGEKTLPFGIKIQHDKHSEYALEIAPGFEDLIETLQPKQNQLSEFIRHFRQYKNLLIRLAESLPKKFQLSGIYFSAKEIDQYLFSNYLIQKSIVKSQLSLAKPASGYRYAMLGLILVLLSSAYLYIDYYQDIKQAHLIQFDWDQFNQENLNTLDKLKNLDEIIAKYDYPDYFSVFRKSAKEKALLQEAYTKALSTEFLPNLIQQTTQQLAQQQNPQALYQLLALYLMLTGQHALDDTLLKSGLVALGAKDNKTLDSEIKLIQSAVANKVPLPNADPNLIRSARFVLSNAMLSEIIYSKIQAQYNTASENINYDGIEINQPMYLSRNFDDIYQKKIADLVRHFFEDDWVTKGNTINQEQINATIESVKNLYLANYLAYWQNLILKSNFDSIKDLGGLASFLNQISQQKNPFEDFFNAAQTNLLPLNRLSQTANAAGNLSKLTAKMQDYLNANHLNQTLAALQTKINAIASQKNSNQAAYEFAAKRMKTGGATDEIGNLMIAAHDAPEPLKTWLTQIADQSWRLLLNASYQYIDQNWQQTVYPFYIKHINARFPISAEAEKIIEIKDFSKFFNAEGVISQFFNQYLADFVDTSSLYWNLKSLNNQTLPITQDSLEMFMRAALIRKMFFAGNSENPQFSFSMMPEVVDSKIRTVNLNYNQQKIDFANGLPGNTLSWLAANSDQAELIVNSNGKNFSIKKSGPWALLALLNQASIQATNNPKIYRVYFTVDQEKIPFELICDALINPFIPDVLTAFNAKPSL